MTKQSVGTLPAGRRLSLSDSSLAFCAKRRCASGRRRHPGCRTVELEFHAAAEPSRPPVVKR